MSKSKKVVVVDGDKKAISRVGELLDRLGYHVYREEEGNKTLELVRVEKPDLLICDILVPGIHPIELWNTIKNEPGLENVRTIATSEISNECNYKLALDCGADAFLNKPFDSDDLELLVKKIIDNEPTLEM